MTATNAARTTIKVTLVEFPPPSVTLVEPTSERLKTCESVSLNEFAIDVVSLTCVVLVCELDFGLPMSTFLEKQNHHGNDREDYKNALLGFRNVHVAGLRCKVHRW